jgi:Sperm-tail PG-rich repeat
MATETHLFTVLSQLSSAPRWSLKGRHKLQHHTPRAGPGQYNHETLKAYKVSAPCYSIASGRARPIRRITPGPGEYESLKPTVKPSYVFGSCARQTDLGATGKESPGPAAYDPRPPAKTHFNSDYKEGTTKRYFEHDVSPGPGAYNPANPYPVKNVVMGKSRRDGAKRDISPGPGKYNTSASLLDTNHGVSIKSRHSTFIRSNDASLIGPYTQFRA